MQPLPQATLPLIYRIPLTSFQPGKKGKEREEHLKFSTNKIYAGVHWGKRKKIKDVIARHAGLFCRPIARIDAYPVEICYRFFFATRPLDTLNCVAMAKMLEDAFRSLGILEDDDPTHVARSIIEVVILRADNKGAKTKPSGPKETKAQKDYLTITIVPYVNTHSST